MQKVKRLYFYLRLQKGRSADQLPDGRHTASVDPFKCIPSRHTNVTRVFILVLVSDIVARPSAVGNGGQ